MLVNILKNAVLIQSLVHDPEKCVKCGRCIRACKEIQGIEVLGFAGRSTNIHVTTPFDAEFDNTKMCALRTM